VYVYEKGSDRIENYPEKQLRSEEEERALEERWNRMVKIARADGWPVVFQAQGLKWFIAPWGELFDDKIR
jgi:hypothetical protein